MLADGEDAGGWGAGVGEGEGVAVDDEAVAGVVGGHDDDGAVECGGCAGGQGCGADDDYWGVLVVLLTGLAVGVLLFAGTLRRVLGGLRNEDGNHGVANCDAVSVRGLRSLRPEFWFVVDNGDDDVWEAGALVVVVVVVIVIIIIIVVIAVTVAVAVVVVVIVLWGIR